MMTRVQTLNKYRSALLLAETEGNRQEVVQYLAFTDVFYFLVYILHRPDANNDFVYARCREYQANPDGYMDLWAREHYKSTIITFAGILWNLWRDPERTYGIISYTRPMAMPFLRQIKIELETNIALQKIAANVFWDDPKKYAPKWSEKDGLVIRRKSNPKEPSVYAIGLIDGQPAGPHFTDLHYEDIVCKEAVRTPGALKLTTEMFRLSLNLGTRTGRKRLCGTRWHYADAHGAMIKAGTFKPRIYPATKDGKMDGEPYLLTPEALEQKIRDYGPYIAACQLFLNPTEDSLQRFKLEWLRYWKAERIKGLNLYILCDPAASKEKDSDYTVFMCIGLGSDRNYYLVDMVRDRISLTERANVLFRWHQQYKPVNVGYEKYGKDSDIEHFEDRMERDNYRFGIVPLGGRLAKPERISRLIPTFFQNRVYIPGRLPYVQSDGETVDLSVAFVEDEYLAFPFAEHDDMMDCMSRILDDDLGATFPEGVEIDPLKIGEPSKEEEYDPLRYGA